MDIKHAPCSDDRFYLKGQRKIIMSNIEILARLYLHYYVNPQVGSSRPYR